MTNRLTPKRTAALAAAGLILLSATLAVAQPPGFPRGPRGFPHVPHGPMFPPHQPAPTPPTPTQPPPSQPPPSQPAPSQPPREPEPEPAAPGGPSLSPFAGRPGLGAPQLADEYVCQGCGEKYQVAPGGSPPTKCRKCNVTFGYIVDEKGNKTVTTAGALGNARWAIGLIVAVIGIAVRLATWGNSDSPRRSPPPRRRRPKPPRPRPADDEPLPVARDEAPADDGFEVVEAPLLLARPVAPKPALPQVKLVAKPATAPPVPVAKALPPPVAAPLPPPPVARRLPPAG